MRFRVTTLLIIAVFSINAFGATLKIKPGAYRVDINGKVRDVCVDEIANAELSAKAWQTRLSEQGVRCVLSNVRGSGMQASWAGTCSAPGMGKVFETRHDVILKINADGSFDLLTLLSGDLQARIPVHGVPISTLNEGNGSCTSQHDTFRPWQ
jgi:hypothetical protein